MSDFLRQVWRDVKERKNLELYATLIVALGVILADIIGVDTQTVVLEIVMAVLALLAFGLLQDRHTSERVEKKLNNVIAEKKTGQFFNEWDDAPFRERLKTAQDVSILAIAIPQFLGRNDRPFESFLKRGGNLRCILVASGSKAMEMAAALSFGYEREVENAARITELSLLQFRDLVGILPHDDKIQIRLTDQLPFAVMTMIDHQFAHGVMYVTLNGYGMRSSGRPSFTLYKEENEKWFRFFEESYDNLWNSGRVWVYDLEGSAKPEPS